MARPLPRGPGVQKPRDHARLSFLAPVALLNEPVFTPPHLSETMPPRLVSDVSASPQHQRGLPDMFDYRARDSGIVVRRAARPRALSRGRDHPRGSADECPWFCPSLATSPMAASLETKSGHGVGRKRTTNAGGNSEHA